MLLSSGVCMSWLTMFSGYRGRHYLTIRMGFVINFWIIHYIMVFSMFAVLSEALVSYIQCSVEYIFTVIDEK